MNMQVRRATVVVASCVIASMAACTDDSTDVTARGAEVTVPGAEGTAPGVEPSTPGAEVALPGAEPGAQCWQDAVLDYNEGADGSTTAVEAVEAMAAFVRGRSDELAEDARVPNSDRLIAEARATSYEAILENVDGATEQTGQEDAQGFAWTDGDVTIELDVRKLGGSGWHVVGERYVVPTDVCERQVEQVGA